MDIRKGVKVHTFLEVNGIEYPDFIRLIHDLALCVPHRFPVFIQLWCASLQHFPALDQDGAFRVGDNIA